MSGAQKKRTKFTASKIHDGAEVNSLTDRIKTAGKKQQKHVIQQPKHQEKDTSWSITSVINIFLGVVAMVGISYAHFRYMYQIHENQLWFTNIQEVEREISFRTECGLYYSYFKQIINSPSLKQGIQELLEDKHTEHPDTINVLERMNVYQEVILAFIYRTVGISMRPILFYTYSIFGLHAVLISALYLMSWLLSGSWLAGLLAAAFYMFNRLDTTRVETSVPLRESFALPFLWIQAASLAVYFKPHVLGLFKVTSMITVLLSTFLFCLFWQFNQFIMLLQAFSLFGVWVLGLLPARKVRFVMLCQLSSLLAVCLLQFGNKMILSSLAMSFIISALLVISFLGDQNKPQSVMLNIARVAGLSLLSLVLMAALSTVIKIVLKVDSDEHIFKFIQNKLGIGDVRDFDARMYLCLEIFGFLTWDTFERLTQNFVLPFYIPAHLIFLGSMANTVIRGWIRTADKNTSSAVQEKRTTGNGSGQSPGHINQRPELAFHSVQAVFFGALAITTMRMKYLWTPYMCVLAAVGVADKSLVTRFLSLFKISNKLMIEVVRSSIIVIILSVMMKILMPSVLKGLEVETEFWDPDTVELMNWIVRNTPVTASFTGSMQLLAGVKLCTGRPITNHPHYEDKYLRHKTKELYQIYGRRKPKDVHKILKKYKSDFIILEDSICRARSKDGCSIPDLVDIDSGMMPDVPINIQGLAQPVVPRFCEHVRYQEPAYSKYFTPVFENKTFRIYQVL